MRLALGLAALCATLGGCGDDAVGADAAPADAGPPADAGDDAAFPDAGDPDGGTPDAAAPDGGLPPGEVVAERICRATFGARILDVAADGRRVAAVTCSAVVRVVVIDLDAMTTLEVATADAVDFVELSPSGRSVAFGTRTSPLSVRVAAAGAPPAVPIAPGPVLTWRFVAGAEERLLVVHELAASREVLSRTEADGWASATSLAEGSGIRSDLTLVSGSGRSLIYRLDPPAYERVPTDGTAAPVGIAVSPSEYLLAPIGLGDTHGIGHDGVSSLAFIGFDAPEIVTLAPDGVGPDSPLFDIADGAGARYLYFLRNGSPSRRLRDGTGALAELASANATDMAPTPDGRYLVYPSDGTLYSVRADGSSPPTALLATGGVVGRLVHAFAADSSEVAVRVEGDGLRRAPIDVAGAAQDLEPSGVIAIQYDGSGRLAWIAATGAMRSVISLRVLERGASTPVIHRVDATQLWASGSRILYLTRDGTLRIF